MLLNYSKMHLKLILKIQKKNKRRNGEGAPCGVGLAPQISTHLAGGPANLSYRPPRAPHGGVPRPDAVRPLSPHGGHAMAGSLLGGHKPHGSARLAPLCHLHSPTLALTLSLAHAPQWQRCLSPLPSRLGALELFSCLAPPFFSGSAGTMSSASTSSSSCAR